MNMNDFLESGQPKNTWLDETLNKEKTDEIKDPEVSPVELMPADKFSVPEEETTRTDLETEGGAKVIEASASVIYKEESTDIKSELVKTTDYTPDISGTAEIFVPVEQIGDSQVLIINENESNQSQKNDDPEDDEATHETSASLKPVEQLQGQVNELQDKIQNIKDALATVEYKLKTTSNQVKDLLRRDAMDRPTSEDNMPGQEAVLLLSQEKENGLDNEDDIEIRTPDKAELLENDASLDKQSEEEQLLPLMETIALEAHHKAVDGSVKDQEEMATYQLSAMEWATKAKKIQEGLPDIVCRCNEILQRADLARQNISGQSDKFRELITGRHEGFELIVNRMISRLPEKAKSLTDDKTLETKLPHMDLSEWQDLLNGSDSVEEANKKVASRQKQLGTERYRILARWREESDKKRKNILGFVERQVLPALDGIGDGERHSETIVRQIQEASESQGIETYTGLILWFATYEALRVEIFKLLDEAGIRRLDVKRGDKIDYDRHEPFDVEKDMELENEYVKEVIRDGFEYWMEEDKVHRVLRPAQVIIVKN